MDKAVTKIIKLLKKEYPDAKCALNFSTPFQLLLSTILSAQCTDVRVNKVTEILFKDYSTPEDFTNIDEEVLREYIKSCGMYIQKSKNIISMSNDICQKHGGEVPADFNELIKLAGVGRKTANVVLCNAFNIPAFAVDTHVFRVANRIGLASSNKVDEVEQQLMNKIERSEWCIVHHLLISHGRAICIARKPKCSDCKINTLCKYYKESRGKVND